MLRVIAFMFAGLLASTAAMAADNGVYLGVGVSQAQVDFDYANASVDGDDTKYKIIAGVRPLDWLAVEVNYVDFGSIDVPGSTPATRGEYRLKGFDAFVVGLLEVGLVDFYLKGGVVRFDRDLQINNVSTSIPGEDDTGYEPAYGGGIQAHLGSLSVRGEYERFEIGSNTKVGLISLGITWTFL